MYHVILAGGTGTRFWPLSRKKKPKQLLRIMNDKKMIRITVDRLLELTSADRIMIVASNILCELIRKEIPEIPQDNFIVEPNGRNTAPAVGLAAIQVRHREKDTAMGIYPSDHLILGKNEFASTIQMGESAALEQSALITIGIQPTYPATGYGYIQFKPEADSHSVQKVITFTEKPTRVKAEDMIKSGEYFWNSGMFIWKAEEILRSIEEFMPDLNNSLEVISNSIGTKHYESTLHRVWELIQPESIDYAILEKADNVFTIPAKYKWSDLGSWKSLFDIMEKNDKGNVFNGEVLTIDTYDSLVFSPEKFTAVIGMKDIAIINLNDATLVMPIQMAERVKEMVDMLKSINQDEYL